MNLTHKSTIKELLAKHDAEPEKYLGQHFILSKKALNLMISAAEINSDAQRGRRKTDTIIEIGPGLGTLTQELATTGGKVIAIEKDRLMVQILRETLTGHNNVQVVQADAKKADLPGIRYQVKSGKGVDKFKYKIVANLPYNVATFLIRQWLELGNPPSSRLRKASPPQIMVLMIQKEVAQRIVAKPPRANLLAMSVQFYADAKIVGYVPKESFWPKPKVDAAIIKIVPKKIPHPLKKGEGQKTREAFFAALKAGFSQPRKQLAGNLAKKLKISKENVISVFKEIDISEQARAENLTLEQWISLTNNISLLPKKREYKF